MFHWYGRGPGWGRGYGRGWGRGFGNPYPFCRFFPWLPRGWWRWGYLNYGVQGYYPPYNYWSQGYYPPYNFPYGVPGGYWTSPYTYGSRDEYKESEKK